MEGPISFWGYKEQESNLILPEHDDDDDDDESLRVCMLSPSLLWLDVICDHENKLLVRYDLVSIGKYLRATLLSEFHRIFYGMTQCHFISRYSLSFVLLTVNLGSILINNQLDAQFFFRINLIPILYMFRAPLCPSSGESVVLIRHLVYVTQKTSEWTKIQKKYILKWVVLLIGGDNFC